MRTILTAAIAEADATEFDGEEEPFDAPECGKCDGTGEITVLRCPRKLLAFTDVPDFLQSYHLWKKDGTLPVGTSRLEQTITWTSAITLFDRWVEDAMKVIREAEAKAAEARARAKARASNAGR